LVEQSLDRLPLCLQGGDVVGVGGERRVGRVQRALRMGSRRYWRGIAEFCSAA